MAKSSSQPDHVIAALDIGSTKVAVLVGTRSKENPDEIQIVGVGSSPHSAAVRQGVVVNIEATTEAISKAVEEAELMSGYSIEHVWVGVSGSHIQSFDSRGMVAIRNREVNTQDIERVIEAAKAVAVPADRAVLHVLPRDFKIDDQDGIYDPIGMSGVRLEASVHIVTGGNTALQNIQKCVDKAGLQVSAFVLQSLSSAMAVLSEDEKKLGVTVVDMGGGTCDLISFVQGSVAHTSVIPVGGMHVTHDIAVGLRTPQASAEILKKKYGCALTTLVNESETIDVAGVGGRKNRTVLRKDLCEVIEPRAEEILDLVNSEIKRCGLQDRLGSGVVLTGGASLLDGFIEMGEFVFDIPIRRGVPQSVGGLIDVVQSPVYATGVGLLLYGLNQTKGAESENDIATMTQTQFASLVRRMKDLFKNSF